MDNFTELSESKYGEGIMIEEYKGSYYLISARKSKGKVYMDWCFPQSRDGSKKPLDKALPWKVKIGDSQTEAVANLNLLVKAISKSNDKEPF